MPCPFSRAVALLGTCLATLAALTGPALAANPGQPAGSAQRAAGSASPAPASRLLLINGALVASGGNGASPAILPPSHGLTGMVATLRLGSRTLVIPEVALPFIGHGLSSSLFDLSALTHAERGGRVPVTMSFRSRLQAPPGVTVTRTGPGTARGYLTAAGAREFGAALARQFLADHDRGSYGTDGLFAGGLSLAIPGVPTATAPVHPDFPMHTLTATATALNGRPDTGDVVFVLNKTNGGALGANPSNFFYRGSVKFSVPNGAYWALGLFWPVNGNPFEARMDVLPQFTVHGNTAVHLSARAASSKVGFAVPRRANLEAEQLDVGRGSDIFGFTNVEPTGSVWVNPVTRVTDRALRAETVGWLASPGHSTLPYTYTLSRLDPPGLILRDQRYVVRPGDLATVRENYFQDVKSTSGITCTTPIVPDSEVDLGVCLGGAVRRPGSQVQYFSASSASRWVASYSENRTLAGGQTGAIRQLHAGEQLTEDWNRYPLHPAPNVLLPGAGPVVDIPSAIRAGNTLSLRITPFSDNTEGHLGTGYFAGFPRTAKVSGQYAIYSDGKRIASGNAVRAAGGFETLGVQAKVSPRPSVIKFVLTATRAGRSFPLSATSRDVWTWPTRPEPRATLTPPWACRVSLLTRADEHCAVQGMLALRYLVAGISLSGTTAPGPQQISLDVDHLQQGPSSPITSVGAQVSANGGRTWQRATVQQTGPTQFSLVFTANPSLVTLRVTARDAAGDTITETLPAAYRIASAPARPQAPPATGALRNACPAARSGRAQCFIMYRTLPHGTAAAATARPKGLTPRNIESAYRLPFRRDSRQTVAIVDAFSTPHLRQYLALYRKQFGLPPCGRCLKIVNQRGQASPLPASGARSGWDLETTLDVDMVSVACPRCHILLVEASNNSSVNLAASENTAARLGAPVISNSYGGTENGFAMTLAKDYHHPGHTIVVSSGDNGFGQANFPADLATVTAVGGTELRRSHDARGWSENVWNDHNIFGGAAASGCSAYVAKPAWQHDRHCPGRTIADVSAVAINIPIYNKVWGGWVTVGGTSIAAPLIAGIYGLAGNAAHLPPGGVYQHRQQLFDITKGENAFVAPPKAVCGDDYLCVAKPGYDAPTGLGTPNGIGAF